MCGTSPSGSSPPRSSSAREAGVPAAGAAAPNGWASTAAISSTAWAGICQGHGPDQSTIRAAQRRALVNHMCYTGKSIKARRLPYGNEGACTLAGRACQALKLPNPTPQGEAPISLLALYHKEPCMGVRKRGPCLLGSQQWRSAPAAPRCTAGPGCGPLQRARGLSRHSRGSSASTFGASKGFSRSKGVSLPSLHEETPSQRQNCKQLL